MIICVVEHIFTPAHSSIFGVVSLIHFSAQFTSRSNTLQGHDKLQIKQVISILNSEKIDVNQRVSVLGW